MIYKPDPDLDRLSALPRVPTWIVPSWIDIYRFGPGVGMVAACLYRGRIFESICYIAVIVFLFFTRPRLGIAAEFPRALIFGSSFLLAAALNAGTINRLVEVVAYSSRTANRLAWAYFLAGGLAHCAWIAHQAWLDKEP